MSKPKTHETHEPAAHEKAAPAPTVHESERIAKLERELADLQKWVRDEFARIDAELAKHTPQRRTTAILP